MADQLKNHSCFVFTREEILYEVLTNMKELPGLIVLEYQLYSHEIFNIYETYKQNHVYIPTIFYNDPVLTTGNRATHWKTIIEMNQRCWEHIDFKPYMPIFEIIQNIVEDPKYRPYIPLMTPALPFPEELNISKVKSVNRNQDVLRLIVRFKIKSNMNERLFCLMEYFYSSFHKDLSAEEIRNIYLKNGKQMKIESIKVRISELKNFLEDQENSPFALIKRKGKYRLVML